MVKGRNGVFTKYLLKHIRTPSLSIEEVLKRVRMDVVYETGEKQIPWESSSLMGEFSFASGRGIAVVTPTERPYGREDDPSLEAERKRLEKERRDLERLKAEIERKKLEAERARLEAEKQKLETAKLTDKRPAVRR